MTIPADQLDQLELRVKRLMGSGRWQAALQEIRDAARRWQEDPTELGRKVASRALELGHVQPIRQVAELQ